MYPGVYGPWKVEPQDVVEVWTYRISISIVAGTFALCAAVPDLQTSSTSTWLTALGAAGLGVALKEIHIYVTPLKRMLQLFWLTGVVGGSYLLLSSVPEAVSLPAYVAEHREAVWLVGPSFAALTGLTFKEGVCYGKGEAFALTLAIPAWLLLHLCGLGGEQFEVDRVFAAVVAVLLVIFAGRKYTQPLKDDIGDGSVFKFQKMSPDEQGAFLAVLERQQNNNNFDNFE